MVQPVSSHTRQSGVFANYVIDTKKTGKVFSIEGGQGAGQSVRGWRKSFKACCFLFMGSYSTIPALFQAIFRVPPCRAKCPTWRRARSFGNPRNDICHFFSGKNAWPRSILGMKKIKKRRQPRLATTLKEDAGKLLLDFGKLVCCPVTPDSLAVLLLVESYVVKYRMIC